MDRVFGNGLGDLGSIPGRIIAKTLKMVLDTSLLNTQQYKVRIKGKVEQSSERSYAPSYTWCSSYWKGSLLIDNFTFYMASSIPIKYDSFLCRSILNACIKKSLETYWRHHISAHNGHLTANSKLVFILFFEEKKKHYLYWRHNSPEKIFIFATLVSSKSDQAIL